MGVGIEVRGLNAWYGKNQSLNSIDMTVTANHVTAVIGPSGCGKSTYVRCLNRMHETIPEARAEGSVKVGEMDVYGSGSDPVEVRRRIGMVFQKPNPFPTMSIYDNVAAGLKLNGFRNRKQMDELVERSLKLAALWEEVKDSLHKKSGASLSGGQQPRPLALGHRDAPGDRTAQAQPGPDRDSIRGTLLRAGRSALPAQLQPGQYPFATPAVEVAHPRHAAGRRPLYAIRHFLSLRPAYPKSLCQPGRPVDGLSPAHFQLGHHPLPADGHRPDLQARRGLHLGDRPAAWRLLRHHRPDRSDGPHPPARHRARVGYGAQHSGDGGTLRTPQAQDSGLGGSGLRPPALRLPQGADRFRPRPQFGDRSPGPARIHRRAAAEHAARCPRCRLPGRWLRRTAPGGCARSARRDWLCPGPAGPDLPGPRPRARALPPP